MSHNPKDILKSDPQDQDPSRAVFFIRSLLADLETLENDYVGRKRKDQLLFSQVKEEKFLDHQELFEKVSYILQVPNAFEKFVHDLEISKLITSLPVKIPVSTLDEHDENMLAKRILTMQHSIERPLQKYPHAKQQTFLSDEDTFFDKKTSYILNALGKEKSLPFLQTIIRPTYLESYTLWLECMYLLENSQIMLKTSAQSVYSANERYIISVPTQTKTDTSFRHLNTKICQLQFN